MTQDHTILPPRLFWAAAGAITLVAWLLREYFIGVAVIADPIRGDVVQYVRYAWNLLHHATFSLAEPALADPVPDSFRSPGYPAFLALMLAIGGDDGGWYPLARHAQALLGASTVLLTILIGRHWLPRAWALLPGLLLAFWPHHIVASATLLSETLFGFLLAGALLLSIEAMVRSRLDYAAAASAAWALAYLTNPVVLFLPLLFTAALLLRRQRDAAVGMAIVVVLAAGAWGVRNLSVPDGDRPGRAVLNLVEGSWPTYHAAYVDRFNADVPRAILAEIQREQQRLDEDWSEGAAIIASRMAAEPGRYLSWYLFEKPWLLWDWSIRIGMGDVYFLAVEQSPLERHKLLAGIKTLLRWLNPAWFALALAAVVLAARRRWPADAGERTALLATAACFVYLTAVHAVFQAEPRYSIPYRGIELLLACSALAALVPKLAPRRGPVDDASARDKAG